MSYKRRVLKIKQISFWMLVHAANIWLRKYYTQNPGISLQVYQCMIHWSWNSLFRSNTLSDGASILCCGNQANLLMSTLPELTLVLSWRRHEIVTLSESLALCAGNPPVTDGFPSERASEAELWCFFWCQPVQTTEQTLEKQIFPLAASIPNNMNYLIRHDHHRPQSAKLMPLTSPYCSGWPATMNTQGQQRTAEQRRVRWLQCLIRKCSYVNHQFQFHT